MARQAHGIGFWESKRWVTFQSIYESYWLSDFIWYILNVCILVEMFNYSETKKIKFGDLFNRFVVYSDVRYAAIYITFVFVKYQIFSFVDI